MIFKIKWLISTFIIYFFLKKLVMPSYISFPVFFKGLNRVTIGKKVRIFPGARIEVHGDGEILIGDNVGIGQNFHITSAGKLSIGSGTVITANVCITNIHHSYQSLDLPVLSQDIVSKPTSIGDNCFIGFGSVILPGSSLGDNCIVGANSVVNGSFPSGSVIAGNPARIIKLYNFNTGVWERV
ncbi:acyltransferase [Photobacterium sp. Hal280]|uniref:acyltransferase n=1 Tax=Photobacterium sp. Hal280 TaxID=3035163 RepID=UPI00301DC40B